MLDLLVYNKVNLNKHYIYSKLLHLTTLCCFFLPFFYFSCCSGPSKAEIEAKEKVKLDSLEAVGVKKDTTDNYTEKHVDTTIQTKITKLDTSVQNNSSNYDTSKTEDKSGTLSKRICRKYMFFKPLLIPRENIYTGVAMAIDSFIFNFYVGTLVAFVLLITSLIVKLIDINARITNVLLEILVIIFFMLSYTKEEDSYTLWGYWVCLSFVIVLTLYDVYVLILYKRLNRKVV